jgi:hypothetical protein
VNSRPEDLPCADDVSGVDGVGILIVGDLQGLQGEAVGGAEVSASDLVDRIDALGIEGDGLGAGDGRAVLQVRLGLGTGEEAKGGVVGEPLCHILQSAAAEEIGEGRLTGEDDAQDEAAVHLEVRDDAEDAEDIGPQLVGVIEDEDEAEAVGVGEGEVTLLEVSYQGGVGARRLHPGGHGDLAAHVAFGEVGHLDVLDAVARLGEVLVDERPEERGLARPGRGDECGGHALGHHAGEGEERLVEDLALVAVAHGDLAGERGGVEAEPAAPVFLLFHGSSGVWGLAGSGQPPSGSMTLPRSRS